MTAKSYWSLHFKFLIKFFLLGIQKLLIRQVAIERIGPIASFLFVIPVTILSALNIPSELICTFLEYWAILRWEIDWIGSFIVSALEVMRSLQFLTTAIGVLSGNATVPTWAELLAFRACFLRSNTAAARNVFCARLGHNRLSVACWWTNNCSTTRVWVERRVRWKLSHRLHDSLPSSRFGIAIGNAQRIICPR